MHPSKPVGDASGQFSPIRFAIGVSIFDAEAGTVAAADGSAISLRPKTTKVLRLLVERAGEMVSRETLMDAVWPGVFVTDDSLTQCITEIRRALGEEDQRLLRTLPRRGYLLVAAQPWERGGPRVDLVAQSPATPFDRPALAVLPFANLSTDPEQEYFADGVTEDIIGALSKWQSFFVIGRNSSFAYKARQVGLAKVRRDLGVGYVLEGSVRRSGRRARITAQLSGSADAHLWSDRYDCDIADVLIAQDEIARRIAAAIEPALMASEAQMAARRPLANPSAWDHYLRGLWHFNRITEDRQADALACFEQAVALDPDLAEAQVGIARVLHRGIVYGLERDRTEILSRALTAARRAIELDHRNAQAWFILAMIWSTSGDAERAATAARRSVELNPSLAWGHFALAVSSLYLGEHQAAVEAVDLALRLSPHEPQRFAWLATRASALYLLRRYRDAIEAAQQSRALRPFATASRVLAASHGQLGLVREAAAALAEHRELATEPTLDAAVRPFLREADRAHYAEGLRKAGMSCEPASGADRSNTP